MHLSAAPKSVAPTASKGQKFDLIKVVAMPPTIVCQISQKCPTKAYLSPPKAIGNQLLASKVLGKASKARKVARKVLRKVPREVAKKVRKKVNKVLKASNLQDIGST
jgi:hypothetical protein